jgi:tRNA-dihydrouridine synthase
MIGRMAVACPWVFAQWEKPAPINHQEIWDRMYQYICEDFEPAVAIRRVKMFAKYYAINFLFGHQFCTELGRCETLADLQRYVAAFFERGPAIVKQPAIGGLR